EERGAGEPAVGRVSADVSLAVTVDDEEVEPAVVVVVEPAEAAAHHRGRIVRDPVAERSLPEGEADRWSDVREAIAGEHGSRRELSRQAGLLALQPPARAQLREPIRVAREHRNRFRRALAAAGLEPEAKGLV